MSGGWFEDSKMCKIMATVKIGWNLTMSAKLEAIVQVNIMCCCAAETAHEALANKFTAHGTALKRVNEF